VSAILALGKLRQADYEFKLCMGYVVRPCLKRKKREKKKEKDQNNK
jgi:hypothetical protein